MEKEVPNFEELRKTLAEFRAGDVVKATVQRGEETLIIDVTLGAEEDIFFRIGTSRMNGPLNRRRDGFPRAIQHDSVIRPSYCGGPVVNIYGDVVGINVARANRVGSYLVPQDVLQSFLREHTAEMTVIQAKE